jgi:hypothetical protein
MRMRARTQFIVLLAVAGALLSGGAVHATDYSVEVGADTHLGKDASSLACRFDRTCHGELRALGLQVDLDFRQPTSVIARLRLYSRNPGCCYFEYGLDEITIDPREPLHQVPIFKGMKARGSMIVENERVGSLHLKFHLQSPNQHDDRRRPEQPI